MGWSPLTLHVGAGTFLPVRSDTVAGHKIHAERGILTAAAAQQINAARRAGGRIVAVGTTSLRLLESACDENGVLHPFAGETEIFIVPGGRKIRAADLLLTNFHLPRSTLFMLVCAFAGTARMRAAYAHAIAAGYRFLLLWRRHPPYPGPAMTVFSWQPEAADGAARAGLLHTAHGMVPTPTFMAVGTAATVKAMTADAVRATGAGIVLGNTYHLMLRPGPERVARLGGPAQTDGLAWPDPYGFRWLSDHVTRQIAHAGCRWGDVPLASGTVPNTA